MADLQTRLSALISAIGTDVGKFRKTFPRDIQGAAPATPAAGTSYDWTTDGKSLDMKAPNGTVTRIGPSAGGTPGVAASYGLTQEYTNTNPGAPATGLTIFARRHARALAATVGPNGLDTRYQPAIFSNRIARMNAVNAQQQPTTDGAAFTYASSGTTNPVAITTDTSGFFAAMVRSRFASAATAGSSGLIRVTTPQWFLSATSNLGGFFFVARFGLWTAPASGQGFFGLTSQAANYATTAPGSQLNQIGLYFNNTDTNFKFITAGSAVGTPVDLGANFPCNVAATWFFELNIFCPSGLGQYGFWSMTRLNDNVEASGSFGSPGLVNNTLIPNSGVLLAPQLVYNNGVNTTINRLEVQSLYIESDN